VLNTERESVIDSTSGFMAILNHYDIMVRFYIFYTCLAIYGAAFAIGSIPALTDGSISLPTILGSIAGIGMMIASVYEMFTGSPSDFEIGDIGFWAVVLAVVGFLLLQVPELL